ncbi:MAG TPA: penicillin-binding transpeptidase domain-containing protein [Solirubrobacteraceae bacterium]|nr:penicillin-binding transpeptidase domain-containing protein [Solirubrobacteraceae bacterium]
MLAVAALAFLGGLVVGSVHQPAERALASRFVEAWERGDYAAMHALLTPEAKNATSVTRFARAYRRAATTATVAAVHADRLSEPRDGSITVAMRVRTRIWGEIDKTMTLPIGEDDDGEPAVAWDKSLVFPGLAPGEELSRQMRMPPRATLRARDGTVIAQGEERSGDLDPLASEIAGRIGPAPAERAAELAARGVPSDADVGLTGLEREFDAELAGTPGGELLAGVRELATVPPERGHGVRTTIDPEIQLAAVEALAGRYGGIAAVRPRTGEVLALSGLAFSAPQPPGSVFKIITLSGAVDAKTVRRNESFPVQTAATLEGVELENANGESCGGTLMQSFAHSCNSVFAPLGAELGAKRLVATAEHFGFNEDPGLAGAARSTIPAANEIGDDLAVGSTAIGQGKVLATPLQMALVAATIGEDGIRPRPTLRKGDDPKTVRAIPEPVARFVERSMRAVVTGGTGVGAAIDGVPVAGKTGTAELRNSVEQDPLPQAGEEQAPPPEDDPTDTDAWFAAFAPAGHPRIAVCVLLIAQGAGGEVAAPAARHVIEAAVAGA